MHFFECNLSQMLGSRVELLWWAWEGVRIDLQQLSFLPRKGQIWKFDTPGLNQTLI